MGIITDFLPRFFERQKFKALSQTQVEGLLDILVFTMVADGHVDDRERDELARAAGQLPWTADAAITDYIARAERRLDGAATPPEFLARAADALDEEWMQDDAYFMAAQIAGADSTLAEEETHFLHALTTALGLGGERLRVLTRRLIHEDHV